MKIIRNTRKKSESFTIKKNQNLLSFGVCICGSMLQVRRTNGVRRDEVREELAYKDAQHVLTDKIIHSKSTEYVKKS